MAITLSMMSPGTTAISLTMTSLCTWCSVPRPGLRSQGWCSAASQEPPPLVLQWHHCVLGVVCRGRVSVAKDDVQQPVRNDAFRVHQVADCLQHSLEVVLLRLPTQNDVERLVYVLADHKDSTATSKHTDTHTYRHKHTWSFCLMDLLLSETAFINWYDASMRNTQRKRRENRLIQTHLEKMANDTMCDVRKMWVNGLTRNSATFQLVSQVVCSKQKREDKTNYDDDDLHLNRDHVNQFTYLIKSWQRHDKQCKVLSVLARDAPMSTGRLSVGR